MVLRKITIDNSVKYIPKIEQTKEKNIKQYTIKNKKQNKNCSKNNKNFLINVAAGGFSILTK